MTVRFKTFLGIFHWQASTKQHFEKPIILKASLNEHASLHKKEELYWTYRK